MRRNSIDRSKFEIKGINFEFWDELLIWNFILI